MRWPRRVVYVLPGALSIKKRLPHETHERGRSAGWAKARPIAPGGHRGTIRPELSAQAVPIGWRAGWQMAGIGAPAKPKSPAILLLSVSETNGVAEGVNFPLAFMQLRPHLHLVRIPLAAGGAEVEPDCTVVSKVLGKQFSNSHASSEPLMDFLICWIFASTASLVNRRYRALRLLSSSAVPITISTLNLGALRCTLPLGRKVKTVNRAEIGWGIPRLLRGAETLLRGAGTGFVRKPPPQVHSQAARG
jgi:hypothetical protein